MEFNFSHKDLSLFKVFDSSNNSCKLNSCDCLLVCFLPIPKSCSNSDSKGSFILFSNSPHAHERSSNDCLSLAKNLKKS